MNDQGVVNVQEKDFSLHRTEEQRIDLREVKKKKRQNERFSRHKRLPNEAALPAPYTSQNRDCELSHRS
jgi:hypothetical protein